MTVREYDGTNDEFGQFITKVRDESIDLIARLLDPTVTTPYSVLIQKTYSDAHNDAKLFSIEMMPAFVDEVIVVLLQNIGKASLIDSKIDILHSNDLGEIVSDDSLYKHTDSLSLDYLNEWRRKYGKHKVIDVE